MARGGLCAGAVRTRGYHDVLPSDYCTTARVNGFKVRYERGAWKSLEFEACHKGFAGNAQRGGRYGIFPGSAHVIPPLSGEGIQIQWNCGTAMLKNC